MRIGGPWTRFVVVPDREGERKLGHSRRRNSVRLRGDVLLPFCRIGIFLLGRRKGQKSGQRPCAWRKDPSEFCSAAVADDGKSVVLHLGRQQNRLPREGLCLQCRPFQSKNIRCVKKWDRHAVNFFRAR